MTAEIVYEFEGRRVVHPLDKAEVTVGRSARNDIVIGHATVSRQHAKLYQQGRDWRVVDLGSTYGTQVNDLGHTDTVLRDGDKIFLHRFPLTFVSEAGSGASLTPQTERPSTLGMDTVFQSAVDFSALAAGPSDAAHLKKLLEIVTRASHVILTSPSLDQTFRQVLDLVFEHLPVQRGFIMLWDAEQEDLVTRCVKHTGDGGSEIRFSRTIAEKVYRDKVAVLTTDAQIDERFAAGQSIQALGIRSAMAAPLWKGDTVDGIIYVDTPLQRKAFDKLDLDLLSALGNHVAVAIEQSRLQQSIVTQQLVRRRLERYHSPAVVERITAAGDDAADALSAEERDVTVLFADLVRFTDRCETMEPREVAEWLNGYFSEMSEAIFRHEGTLDKFIGDCLMAVFGAPLATRDHARRAVEAALDMREALEEINGQLPEDSRVEFRVGLHSGRVVAGDIGSHRRSDYTVLGATVNLAARLESTVARPGQIILTEVTVEALGGRYETRCVGEYQPKGISKPVRCFELLGRRGEPTA